MCRKISASVDGVPSGGCADPGARTPIGDNGNSISVSSISSNIKKGSVRKVNRKFQSVQKHKSVGSLGKSSERESEMDSFSLSLLSSSKRINGQPLLAETKANKKRGRGWKVAWRRGLDGLGGRKPAFEIVLWDI